MIFERDDLRQLVGKWRNSGARSHMISVLLHSRRKGVSGETILEDGLKLFTAFDLRIPKTLLRP